MTGEHRPLNVIKGATGRAFIKIDSAPSALRRGKTPARATSTQASIDQAMVALRQSFAALATQGPLDLNSLNQAGDTVIDAIGEVGLQKWLGVVRAHHKSTFQHCLIVTGVASSFGQRAGMRRADVAELTMAGLLHDVGKAQIPLSILDKPGKLTEAETAQVRSHPVTGFEYLKRQQNISPHVLSAVRHHHEYLDGTGYPDGLIGDQIDDITRIITICDVYAALIEARAYKPPMTPAQAMSILHDMANQGKLEKSLVTALASS